MGSDAFKNLVIVVALISMVALFQFVNRTRTGRAMRAVAEDKEIAALMGIDVDRAVSITFATGAAMAGVAGLLFAVVFRQVHFFMGFFPGLKAFTAAVLGGIGSLPGAMLGGLIIGLIEVFWSAYFSVEYKDVAAFSLLAVVLIFLPSGLLGRPEIEKVSSPIVEAADSSFAEHDCRGAACQTVLAGRQPLFDRRGHSPFHQDRTPRPTGRIEQSSVVHVARADLDEVGHLGHSVDR